MPTVLVIDDNPAIATALEVLFSLHDIRTLYAPDPEEGMRRLAAEPVDLVVQDMNFRADTTSGEEGEALFRRIREAHPDLPIVLLTAWTHLDAAVSLIKAGAADYLGKPWDDARLMASVGNLIELGQANRLLARERGSRQRTRAGIESRLDLRGMVWADDAMAQLLGLAAQVAPPRRAKASSRRPTAARCSWTKSATCRQPGR